MSSTADMDVAPVLDQRPTSLVPLVAVCMTMFIVTVDSTMMNVAIPTIVDELGTTIGSLQAGVAVYSLVMASFMTAGGKFANIIGTKKALTVGLSLYLVGTLMAAVSPNVAVLVLGWSVIEGLGAAALVPVCLALLVVNYRGKRRAMSFAIMGGVQSSAAALGPLLGGALTTYLSWRWGFAGEGVIVVTVFIMFRRVAGAPPRPDEKLDVVGVILSALGFGLIVAGALLAGPYGWWTVRRPFELAGITIEPFGLSVTPLLFVAGLSFLVAFAHWVSRREREHKTPLFKLGLLKIVEYTTGTSSIAVMTFILGGLMFIVPLFLQVALGFDPFETGVAMLPLSLALLAVALGTGGLGTRVPPKLLVQVGIILTGVGIAVFRSRVSFELTDAGMILPFLLVGAGLGLILGQINNLTLSAVPEESSNEASGLTNTVKELGRSLGVAIIGSVLTVTFFTGVVTKAVAIEDRVISESETTSLSVELEDASNRYGDAEFQTNVIDKLPPEVQARYEEIQQSAAIDAMRATLLVLLSVTGILFLISTFLARERLGDGVQPPGEYTHSTDDDNPVPV
jgi:MFS family permease